MESEIGGAGYTQGSSQFGFQQLSDSMSSAMASLHELSGATAEYQAETDSAGSSASRFGSIISSIAGSAVSGLKTMFSGLVSTMRMVGSVALTTAKNIAQIPFKAVSSGANLAQKALSAFHKKSNATTLSTNGLIKGLTGLKRMLLTRVKRMFISAVFNQVRASLQSLAKYSSEFNQSMSNIKNSAKGMSGNLAVAFGNLVNAVAPVLQTIIGWLSQAISYLNAFFALLSGKSSITVAKKSTDDYAKSLKGAGGAAKELKNQVYGFDELTKQEDNSGGGGGGGGSDIGFEEQDIASLLPESIRDLFENIKKAFEAGEFEKVGNYIADGLNMIIYSVDDWINNTLRPAGVKWAGIIARILNGIVDGLDWTALGKLFGDGINTLLEIGYTFLTTFDWAKLGQKFAEGVNSLFTTVDWGLLGRFLAAKLNALILTISNFFANLDWGNIGSSVGKGINSWFTSVKWDDLAKGITDGVNGIVTAVQKFLDTVDWETITNTFITGINSLVHDIDWKGMLVTLFFGFLQFLVAFWKIVAGIDWSGLAKSFADGLNTVFGSDENGNPNFDWDGLTSGITGSINGIVEGIRTFIDGLNWGDIATTFSNGINSIIDGVDWTNLVFTLFLGLYKLVNTLFMVISNINWSGLGSKIAEGLNKVFGKSSTGNAFINWDDLGKQFGDAVKGIIEGIDSFVTETDWQAVGTAIGDALGNVDWVGIATKLIGLLWDALWGAVELLGGLTQRLVELIFGTKEEQVQVPDVFSGDVEEQLKQQAGEAGKNAAEFMMTEFVASTSTGQEDAQQAVIAAAAALGTGFQDEMYQWLKDGDWSTQWGEEFSLKANDLFRSITLESATVDSVKAAFSSAGIEVTDGFAEAITGTGAENIGAALMLLAAGVDQDTVAALDLSNLHANLFAYMNETGKDLETVAGELAESTGDTMGRLMPEGMIEGYDAGKAELENKADELEDLASTKDSREAITGEASTTGEEVDSELGASLAENKGVLSDGMESVTESIEDPLSELPDNVKPYAESIMIAVTQAIIDGDPTAVAAQAVVDKAAEIMSMSKGEEIATAFINGMNNGIVYNYSPLISNIGEIGSQVISSAESYLSESNGSAIGGNMIIGMINGFNKYGQMLVNTMARICSVCVSDARRILGIASPSKVFEQIGEYVMEGMQIGLEDTGADAIQTVGDIAQAMTEEAQNGNGIHVAIDAITDGLEGAENSLMRIADIFIGIANSITEIGGLHVPAVANGQILPYNATALGNSNHVTEGSSQFDGLEDALYNAISRAQSNSSDGEPVVIKLLVDGRELTDVVTKYQRQQARAWG